MTIKQPLCRADLVDAVMASIHNPAAIGETYEALGPERMTQADLLTYMYALTSRTEEDLNFRYGVNIHTLFSSLSSLFQAPFSRLQQSYSQKFFYDLS